MREVTRAGASVEEAVAAALEELGVGREQVEVEVVQEARRGVLGVWGGREALVRVRVRQTAAEMAGEFVRRVGEALGLRLEVAARAEDGAVMVEAGGEDVGVLIGRRGETLDALEYLVALGVRRRFGDKVGVSVDVGGYRRRRSQALAELARRSAARAVRTGREVALRPMCARERRVVHLALRDYPGVRTGSRGEEPFRRVVITPVRAG